MFDLTNQTCFSVSQSVVKFDLLGSIVHDDITITHVLYSITDK